MEINWNEIKGDLLKENTGIIVHGCNAQGVMGAGLALKIKTKYPEAYDAYINAYKENNRLDLGSFTYAKINKDLYIVNAITQEFYGSDKDRTYVNYDAIQKVFESVFVMSTKKHLPIKMPRIGCGLGNGQWWKVQRYISKIRMKGIGASMTINVFRNEWWL